MNVKGDGNISKSKEKYLSRECIPSKRNTRKWMLPIQMSEDLPQKIYLLALRKELVSHVQWSTLC